MVNLHFSHNLEDGLLDQTKKVFGSYHIPAYHTKQKRGLDQEASVASEDTHLPGDIR